MSNDRLRALPFSLFLVLGCVTLSAQTTESESPRPKDRIDELIEELDQNGDGKVSRSETPPAFRTRFNTFDVNQDGFLDHDEFLSLANQSRRRRSQNGPGTLTTRKLLASAPKTVVVEPDIAYREGESDAWRLDLVRPKDNEDTGATGTLRPAIVFVHGGGWRSGDKRRGYFINGALEYAEKGYVCVSVNYRLTSEAKFPACIEDVKCAVRWLRANAKRYRIDPKQIGGYGNSAGAHLVAMLGLADSKAGLEGDGPYQDHSSMLQAVCCSATPTNMLRFERMIAVPSNAYPGSAEEVRIHAKKASPMTYVNESAPPFLVIHGTADRTVPVVHGDSFVDALKEAGAKSVEYIRIDDAGHSVFNEHAKRTHPAMEAFFAKHLGNP